MNSNLSVTLFKLLKLFLLVFSFSCQNKAVVKMFPALGLTLNPGLRKQHVRTPCWSC